MYARASVLCGWSHSAQFAFAPRQEVAASALRRKAPKCLVAEQCDAYTTIKQHELNSRATTAISSPTADLQTSFLPISSTQNNSTPHSSSVASLGMATAVLKSLQLTLGLLQANQASEDYAQLTTAQQLQAAIGQQQQLLVALTEAARERLEATAAAVPAAAVQADAGICAQNGNSSSRSSLSNGRQGSVSHFTLTAVQVPHSSSAASSSSSSSSSSNITAAHGCCSSSSTSSLHQGLAAKVFMAGAADKGRKQAMEDFHTLAAINSHQGVRACAAGAVDLSNSSSCAFGAIFDGHGGHYTAAYTAGHFAPLLHKELCRHAAAAVNSSSSSSSVSAGSWMNADADGSGAKAALHSAFLRQDKILGEMYECDRSGSTAVVALVNKRHLVVANAGDSVAVLARGGACRRLSATHRPDNPAEAARVVASGGLICMPSGKQDGVLRVMKDPRRLPVSERYVAQPALAVTRAFGDFKLKSHSGQVVTAEPHLEEVALSPADRLLLLTSDGVTDVLSDTSMVEVALAAVEQASNHTDDGQTLAQAAAAAVKATALDVGAWDNLTVVAMLLDWNNTWTSSGRFCRS